MVVMFLAYNLILHLPFRYEVAKAEVDRVLGIHFDRRFPQDLRQCNDTCGCGLYPTTTDGRFSEPGIDLVTAGGQQVRLHG